MIIFLLLENMKYFLIIKNGMVNYNTGAFVYFNFHNVK